MTFYSPVIIIVYTAGDYYFDPGHHTNTHFCLTYGRDILFGTYNSYSDSVPETYATGT